MNILLVEDNPDDEELTVLTLQEHHFADALHVVRDGAEALDYIFCQGKYSNRHPELPSLILLDLKLPKLSGMEVLAHIKGEEQTRAIPVVVLTSSREEPDIERCYALGVNSYIVKPVDFSQFKAAITQLGLYWKHLNISPHR